jgi:hypothetical protein
MRACVSEVVQTRPSDPEHASGGVVADITVNKCDALLLSLSPCIDKVKLTERAKKKNDP